MFYSAVHWDAVVKDVLRRHGRLESRIAAAGPGWKFSLREKSQTVAGIPGCRLLWIEAEPHTEGDDYDGARILLWKKSGALRGQILQTDAVPMHFNYGEGVLWGSAKVTGKWLVIAGDRFGQSPFGYGGIEVWEHVGDHWRRLSERTSIGEITEHAEFVGSTANVRFALKRYPEVIAMAHGGSGHLAAIGTYHFSKGHFYRYTECPIASPLRTLDNLLLAVTRHRKSFPYASPSAWRAAQRFGEGGWSLDGARSEDEETFYLTRESESPGPDIVARVVPRGRGYWVSWVKRWK
jgi:hypothetical protein